MKTLIISPESSTLRDLLKKAKRKNLVLRTTEGDEYILCKITSTRSFYVGDSEDFAEEVKQTRRNKRLTKFLDERDTQAKGKKGIPLKEVRKQLGL